MVEIYLVLVRIFFKYFVTISLSKYPLVVLNVLKWFYITLSNIYLPIYIELQPIHTSDKVRYTESREFSRFFFDSRDFSILENGKNSRNSASLLTGMYLGS